MSIVERARVALRNWINKPSHAELAAADQRLLDSRLADLRALREAYATMTPEGKARERSSLRAQVERLRTRVLTEPSEGMSRWIALLEAELKALELEALASAVVVKLKPVGFDGSQPILPLRRDRRGRLKAEEPPGEAGSSSPRTLASPIARAARRRVGPGRKSK